MKKFILLLPLAFLLTACPESSSDSNDNIDLSENPEGFVFRWNNGGGMINKSWNARICEDSAHWTFNRYGQETTLRWTPESDEFIQFYQDLREQEFNKIESDCKGEVFDRGGNTIYIDQSGESYKIDNSGNCFIQEEWGQNYAGVMKIMNSYIDEQIKKQLISVDVEVSESLNNSGFDIRFSSDSHSNGAYLAYNKDTTSRIIEMYPGYNQLTIKLDYKDSTDYYGSPVNFIYEDYFEEIEKNSKLITLGWENGKILLDQN